MLKKIIFLLLFVASSSVFAQYETAAGLRLTGAYAITLKHFVSKSNAFEGLLYGYGSGVTAVLLYEKHQPEFENGFRTFYGFGGHVGTSSGRLGRYRPYYVVDTGVSLGIDAIGGIEYNFNEVPINLSLDWKPSLGIINSPGLYLGDVAISVRWAFKR